MQTLIIIPARYGSTRFPGKPLHMIRGRTLLSRVIRIAEQASESQDTRFLVATDHEEIEAHCRDNNTPCVMTDPDLASGTDRALAAIEADGTNPDFVINLQGDAPFTPAKHVAELIKSAKNSNADVFTPVIQLDWEALDILRERKKTLPFSGTTCLRNPDGKAFWFSKNILPSIRNEEKLRAQTALSPVFRHIGLYGYTLSALQKFAELPVGNYEKLEGLEQLRFLENNMSIQTIKVETPRISMSGVDTLEDAELAEQLIDKYGDPYKAEKSL